MKKNVIKKIVMLLAVCAVSAFACMASGCNVTDKIKEKIEQARCEHEWNDGEVTKEATCMEKGELTKTCTLCEKVETEEIELAEHIAVYVQAVSPTCLEKGFTDGTVCSVCETKLSGFQEIPALGHIVVKDSAVKPTCLEEGLTEGEHCSRCDEVLKAQEKVPATGHNLVILEAVEPTCTTEGKTQGVWCDKCEMIFTEPETIAMIDCVDVDGDKICDVCDNVLNIVAVEEGELVAGKTYRVYIPERPNLYYFYLSCADSTYIYIDSSIDANQYLWWSGNSGPIYYLEGLEVVKTDTYIEFTFKPGTYKILKYDGTDTGDTFVIDQLTALESTEGIYRVEKTAA